jgi:hypothetical protein
MLQTTPRTVSPQGHIYIYQMGAGVEEARAGKGRQQQPVWGPWPCVVTVSAFRFSILPSGANPR